MILRNAADLSADLIVIGAKGLSAPYQFRLGSTAHGETRAEPFPLGGIAQICILLDWLCCCINLGAIGQPGPHGSKAAA